MNTRFNFLVQFALVAMFFSFSTIDGFGQLRDKVDDPDNYNEGIQGGIGCYDIMNGEQVTAYLMINASSIARAKHLLSSVGCDLHIGLTSNGIDSYVSLGSIDDNNFALAEVELPESKDEDLLNVPDKFQISSSEPTNVVNAVEISVNLSITKLPVDELCAPPDYSQEHVFTLDLYCLDSDGYTRVNPCEFEDLFIKELIEDCSLSQDITIDICCWDGFNPLQNDDQIQILTDHQHSEMKMFEKPLDYDVNEQEIVFFDDLFKIKSKNLNYSVGAIEILNLSGQAVIIGNYNLPPKGDHILNCSDLHSGIYIYIVSDNLGNVNVGKFYKQ